ncbi:MAG: CoA-acylating methylmalonate-semialdehyde dehydrogenase [Planctomycetota bacterium]|nr:CoA-acylating methylmalonate-semialdehyde dehydrogenase [Planctomycetota bacterium]
MTDRPIAGFINGLWTIPTDAACSDVMNPSTGAVIGILPHGGARDVELAVEAASRAFIDWSARPVSDRAKILHRYRMILAEHQEELSRLICLENGKTLEEARGDVLRGMEVVEFACNIPHLLKGESLPQVAEEIDGITTREPIGVCAGVTPFNFPVMVPMWMFPLAIACGNTFILKPSEKVPLSANRLAELFLEAGLPDGVFNVVHGSRDVVDALCTHPGIRAVSFVGSTRVAKQVYETATRHGKRVQAAGGAKNVLLVMPDADLDSTTRAVMGSAFGCAGQRCMAGSLLMGIGSAADAMRERVCGALDVLKLGNPLEEDGVGMGPVIDGDSRDRLRTILESVSQDKTQQVVRGRCPEPDIGYFLKPALVDNVRPEQPLFQQEAFGPILSLVRPTSLDEAIAWMNRLPYGNGATIFTSSGAAARDFSRRIHCGMVGVNVGVPAPMAIFPFSGWGESFFGDLHVQGMEGVYFYTRQKVILSRWDRGYIRKQGW